MHREREQRRRDQAADRREDHHCQVTRNRRLGGERAEGDEGGHRHRQEAGVEQMAGAHPAMQQAPGGDVAGDVDQAGKRRQQPGELARQSGLGIDRRQEADHRQPLAGIHREGDRHPPRPPARERVVQPRRPLHARRRRRVGGVGRVGGIGHVGRGSRGGGCRTARGVGRHPPQQPAGHGQRHHGQDHPQALPADHGHQHGSAGQHQRGAGRHVGPPQPQMQRQPARRHQLPDQARHRQHHQQEAQALERAQHQQLDRLRRPGTGEAGGREHQLAEQHAAAQPEAVRREADEHATEHARHLHHRQQEAGLDQADAKRIAQHRERGRDLADVQRGHHAGDDHDEGGRHAPNPWLRRGFVHVRVCLATTHPACLPRSPFLHAGHGMRQGH